MSIFFKNKTDREKVEEAVKTIQRFANGCDFDVEYYVKSENFNNYNNYSNYQRQDIIDDAISVYKIKIKNNPELLVRVLMGTLSDEQKQLKEQFLLEKELLELRKLKASIENIKGMLK